MGLKSTRKTAYYLRASNGKSSVNLQNLLALARKVFDTVATSEMSLGSGDVLRIQHFRANDIGVFIHLARYIPGEKASTLQPKANAPEDNEGSQSAPSGMEFKDGDSFLLARDHNIIFCSHGISIEKTKLYLALLFEKAGIDKTKREFEMKPSSNLDKLKLLHKHKVKSIELATNAYAISLPREEKQNWIGKVFDGVSNELKALVGKDESPEEQKMFEDLLVNVELRLDGNTRAASVTQNFIENLAESVLDDADSSISEFTIVTQNNDRITSAQIRLQDSFNATKEDGSLSHFSVWEGLERYFQKISQGNLVEQ